VLLLFCLDDANATMSDSAAAASLSQASDETSSSRDAILARIRTQGTISYTGSTKPPAPLSTPSVAQDAISSPIISQSVPGHTGVKKAPVPLPSFVTGNGNGIMKNESSSVVSDATSSSVNSQSVVNHPDINKPSVPLSDSVSQDEDENTYFEVSFIPQDITSSPITPQSTANDSDFKKRPAPLPNFVARDQDEDIHPKPSPSSSPFVSAPSANTLPIIKKPTVFLSNPVSQDRPENTYPESLSVSLDAVLSSKCMFFESEHRINDYQRRDPRTIIYPKLKSIMPKITTNEINILQRYSNT
jgi:hypothetical protein